jgi:hypothetical protein
VATHNEECGLKKKERKKNIKTIKTVTLPPHTIVPKDLGYNINVTFADKLLFEQLNHYTLEPVHSTFLFQFI